MLETKPKAVSASLLPVAAGRLPLRLRLLADGSQPAIPSERSSHEEQVRMAAVDGDRDRRKRAAGARRERRSGWRPGVRSCRRRLHAEPCGHGFRCRLERRVRLGRRRYRRSRNARRRRDRRRRRGDARWEVATSRHGREMKTMRSAKASDDPSHQPAGLLRFTKEGGVMQFVRRATLVLALAALVPAAATAPAGAQPAVPAAATDAVSTWNANAGKAAVAACISPVGPSPAEARLYAMTHVAIHDALNAIDRRSRPYVYDARAPRGASPDAAVAAAARDVLVPVLRELSTLVPPACVDAAVASVEADYVA